MGGFQSSSEAELRGMFIWPNEVIFHASALKEITRQTLRMQIGLNKE